MSTVVYLSNKQLQVVEGKQTDSGLNVSNCLFGYLPEGSLINGVVMDETLFYDYIVSFWNENKLSKEVTLVINSTRFVGQTIELPAMSGEKTIDYIRREFANIDKSESKAYGYIELANNNSALKRLYAESVAPDFVKSNMELFAKAGITVKNIYSGEATIINLIGKTLGDKAKNFVFLISDGISIVTVLFIGGQFKYYNSARSFHERGTVEYAQDIVKLVSQISQFMKANQIDEELEEVILTGLNSEEAAAYAAYLSQAGIIIPVRLYAEYNALTGNSATTAQGCLYAVAGLLSHDRNSNFVYRITARKRGGELVKRLKPLIAILGVGAVMVAIWLAVSVKAEMKKAELNELISHNEDVNIGMKLQDYDNMIKNSKDVENIITDLSEIRKYIDSYPVLTSEVIKHIEMCAGNGAEIKITGFSAITGELYITAEVSSSTDASFLVENLKADYTFDRIDYYGYQQISEERYKVDLKCFLAAGAGKEIMP